MDAIYKSTSEFYNNLYSLLDKYPSVKDDVSEEFKGLLFESIFSKKYVLKDSGVVKILKVRIANSNQNKGKSSGFRVLLIADNRTSEVTFLNIFAKTGTSGKENIDKAELKQSLEIWKTEKKSGMLISIDPSLNFDI